MSEKQPIYSDVRVFCKASEPDKLYSLEDLFTKIDELEAKLAEKEKEIKELEARLQHGGSDFD